MKCLEGRSIVHPIKLRVPKQARHAGTHLVCLLFIHTHTLVSDWFAYRKTKVQEEFGSFSSPFHHLRRRKSINNKENFAGEPRPGRVSELAPT